jgi:rhomboid protease GluP
MRETTMPPTDACELDLHAPVLRPAAEVPADASDATPAPAARPTPPPPASFEQRLKSATPWTPVTWTLVLVNGLVFTALAVQQGRVLDFSPYALLTWGAADAPHTFMGQWWRPVVSVFLHGDLLHLAGNLFFLLLMGPLVERLLGPFRFAAVYLFAGIGGILLGMACFPATLAVGASTGVFGVYGAFLGCCLRGPRTVSWRVFGSRFGLLLLFAGVNLAFGWLDGHRNFVGHLGGLLFGLAGGFLFGHKLQPGAARWNALKFVVTTAVLTVLLGLAGAAAQWCAAGAVSLLSLNRDQRDREAELEGRFADALVRWEKGETSDAELKGVLEKQLIPEWDRLSGPPPQPPSPFAGPQPPRLSMHDMWEMARSDGPAPKPEPKGPPSPYEYKEMYRLYRKLRGDNWRALADELGRPHPVPPPILLDELAIEQLRQGLDEMANEDNPLARWLDYSPERSRFAKREGRRP